MRKCKLKKDLPLAKVGEVVTFKNKWNIWIIYNETWEKKLSYINIDVIDIYTWLEEIPEKPKSVWDLKKWDEFFCINTDLINKDIDISYEGFKKKLKFWEVFLTEDEAEKELEKRSAIQRIKKYCWENNINLADNEYIKNIKNLKWFIKYILERKIFEKESERWVYCNYIFCFKNEADIEKVIRNCENDLKIIFDV